MNKEQSMSELKGKTIIYGAPTAFGLSGAIKEQLERVGLIVYDFSPILDQKFTYKNIWQRLHNLYRKVIHNDYENKKQLRLQQIEECLFSYLDTVPEADFSFFIRPDLFPYQFVKQASTHSTLSVGYQWDGLKRYPKIKNYISLFDRFFVFDSRDIKDNLLRLTNFYIADVLEKKQELLDEAYFIGCYDDERAVEIDYLGRTLNNLGINTNFIVMVYTELYAVEEKKYSFQIIDSYITYSENLKNVRKSKILIDIQTKFHDGLSFRMFEALYYNKKIITTNHTVKQYDFYDPANIFVWNGKNQKDLSSFLKTPICPVPQEIKEKYSFDSWINYVLAPKHSEKKPAAFIELEHKLV